MILVMNMEKPQRKSHRIENFDCSQTGAYFITLCTQDRKRILSKIRVGTPGDGCPYESFCDCPVCPYI